ncbi:ABC transporter ATP-binding protein [Tundrisphaera sp. TA3]|uniref:ABC transporter ATP-binding protein n=1 Tax=Tundrisphaera sp. TA3 TaxID=3435775 RepID=UPI003EBFF312
MSDGPTMIDVERLSKSYHATRAVDGLTFRVGTGEIVGLLGPNGAGKTTTMRMLTTFLAPTSGRAVLAGHDVLDDPLGVRRRVGYLPESVPLYGEMRVREYLDFRARLKDVPRSKRRSAIDHVLDRCQVRDVERRTLGHLSKGYRQRVGLADAMVHDPDILVLDEPTAGLDPIQIREVRDLIRELGDRHTILLSTHIMSEVEAVCGRVLMIVGGRLAIDEKLDQIDDGTTVVLEARGPAAAIRKAIEKVDRVRKVAVIEQDEGLVRMEVQGRDGADVREAVAACVVRGGWGLAMLDQKRSTLEERFVRAVHEASLADDAAAPAIEAA